MITIELNAIVNEDGTVTVKLPDKIEPGEYKAVLVLEEKPAQAVAPTGLKLPLSQKLKMLKMDNWPINATFRREEIYDDRGF
jgi:hypothetical protein